MNPCVSYLIGRRIVVRLVTGSRHLSGQARPARRPGFRASRRCLRAVGGPVAESDLITRDVSDGLRYANVDRLQLGARPRHEETMPPAKMASHANHTDHAGMQGTPIRPIKCEKAQQRGCRSWGPIIGNMRNGVGGRLVVPRANVAARDVGQGKGRLDRDLSVGAGPRPFLGTRSSVCSHSWHSALFLRQTRDGPLPQQPV